MKISIRTGRAPRLAVLLAAALIAMVTLVVLPAARASATPVSTTYVDDGSLSYGGSWNTTTDSGYYGGTLHYTNTVGATMSYVFTGSFVRVIGATNTNMGQMGVQICNSSGTGCSAQTVADEAALSLQKQEVIWQNYNIGSGSHMIKLTLLSTTTGSDTYFHIDAVAYGTPLTGDRYVSSTGCSDSNAGTSSGAPWCTFNNVNGEAFGPGARILLNRGSSWDQELGKLYGAGNSSSPIVIGAYGSGAKPKIDRDRDKADRGVWLDNPDWWTIRNIEVADAGAGIVAYFTNNGHQGLRFENVYTHNNNVIFNPTPDDWHPQADLPGMYHGAAIFITGVVPVTTSDRAISNIVLDGVESSTDSDPIDIAGFNPPAATAGLNGFLRTELGHHAAGDITIKNSYFHDADGAPNFDNVESLNIFSTRFIGMCHQYQSIGTTGLFLWSTDGATMANNVIGYLPDSGSGDGTSIDNEAYDSNFTFTGNWFGRNQGSGLEFLQILSRPGDYMTGHLITNNVFQQNGMSVPGDPTSLEFIPGGGPFSGTASDNLSYETWGFNPPGTSSGPFTLSNNRGVSANGVFAAGNDYTPTQGTNNWTYQSFNGTSWSNLSYDSANDQWGSASGSVSRFNERPTACATCWVAHAWTAPYAGVVQLRGQVFKNELGGDGVVARITKNGTKIWPSGASQAISASDVVGVAAPVNDLTVAAGDVLRFEVSAGSSGSNTSDLTSWAPIVGYSSITNGAVSTVQDTTTGTGDGQVNYASGTWSTTGSIHYNLGTTTTADYLIKFTGTQVVIHGGRNSDRGIGAFSICDAAGSVCGGETLVDMYNPTLLSDQVNWTSPTQPYGTYTVKVRTTNTKNGSSSGTIVDLDYATVSGNGFMVNDDVTGSGENQVNYVTGTWTVAGNVHYNTGTTTTAYLLVPFSGTQITAIGGRNTDRGRSGYSICDASGASCGAEVTIDQYASSLLGQQILWTSPVLSSGSHTLKIRTLHTKNASSTDYLVDVDRFAVN